MQGSASLSLCARRQPKRWWVVQWKNSESTDILEVVFQVAQENENHLKRLHSNDSIDLLTYMMGSVFFRRLRTFGKTRNPFFHFTRLLADMWNTSLETRRTM